jgi:hypothetical protein
VFPWGKAAGLGAPFRCGAALSGSPVIQPPFNAARPAIGRILLALPAIMTSAFPRAPLCASFHNHFSAPPFFARRPTSWQKSHGFGIRTRAIRGNTAREAIV